MVTALSDLTFTQFGLSIPSNAINIGITVSTLNISQAPSAATVSQVSLRYSGAQFGTIKTPATPFVPSLVTESYGGPTDTWGAALTTAIINSPSFGFAVAVNVPDTTRVFIGQPFQITVDYDIVTMVPSGQPGGAGNYTVNNSQTVGPELLQTSTSGKSRLAPFQFSTNQGAILEFSAGVVRIWGGSNAGFMVAGPCAVDAPIGGKLQPRHLLRSR